MRIGILILLIFNYKAFGFEKYVLPCDAELMELSMDIALKQVGVVEKTGRNDGDVVIYLKAAGLRRGAPYCTAGQYFCFEEASNKLVGAKIPIPKTSLANEIFNYAMKHGTKARYKVERHDLIVWRLPKSWRGHIERVVTVNEAGWVLTIAFNTRKKISKKIIEGVFLRKRNIYQPLQRMTVRGLVGFFSVRN